MQIQQKINTILPPSLIVSPTLSPAAQIINYLRSKCNLPLDQIQSKLMNGEAFDTIKGEGNDIDTKLMEELLNQNDFYQKPAQKNLKDQAMRFIKGVVEGWSVAIAKNQMRINQDQIHNYTAKLLPFGSYVLDLRSNSSDIDLICVCPNFIQRETHFFGDLTAKLQSQPQVKNLATRANARVPIITFFYKQIQIDISFCQLDLETIPKDIEKVISSELVASIKDQQSRTSLLGRKNNLMILELTGKQMENFKQTLRVVKVWAKNRGISSNVMGYLGGISWAILVAKVCQLFPNHKPAKLLSQFFTVFSIWNWNQVPVRIMPAPSTDDKQKEALMCVVTPGSDYNSTERVNTITYKQLYEEIRRANEIMSAKRDFNQVCRKVDFFNLYELYMEIDICGSNKGKDDAKDYKDFLGLVESRVLKLLLGLSRQSKKQIEQGTFRVVPNPKIYKKNDQSYQFCNSIFFGFEIAPTASVNICKSVKEWCIQIDQARPSNKLNVRVFEGKKQDFADVQINQVKKKKQEKEDPRLARRRKAAQTA